MKCLLVFCCVIVAVISEGSEHYTDKYDNTNVREIVGNKRLLTKYVDCVMERGPCPPEGKELKTTLPDALQTKCSKCTKPQEEGATIVIDHLIKNEPEIWKELAEKFDPEGKYRQQYEEEARARGIEIPK